MDASLFREIMEWRCGGLTADAWTGMVNPGAWIDREMKKACEAAVPSKREGRRRKNM